MLHSFCSMYRVIALIVLSFVLTACGGGGGGGSTNAVAPVAPAGVNVIAGNASNTISWSPVSGASSYNIYWSTTSGVTTATGTSITGVSSPYDHASLSNGTPYYYIVTAQNSAGESPASSEVSATPALPLPGAPSASSSAGNTSVTISWGVVADATSYNVYWSTSSAVSTTNGTRIADTSSPHEITGLTNGTTYYFIVTAQNATGEGSPSAPVSATPSEPLPGQVTGVSAIGGDSAAQLYWSDVVDATSYNIYWSTSSGVTTTTGTKISGVTSPHSVGSLTNEVPYYFIVTAQNTAGEGPASTQVSATPTAPLTGWGSKGVLGGKSTSEIAGGNIAINSSGKAIATWYRYGGGAFMGYVSIYDNGAWGNGEAIGNSKSLSSRVAINDSGNGVVVWEERLVDATSFWYSSVIWMRRLINGNWQAAEQVSLTLTDDLYASDPDVAIDASGNIMVVWYRSGQVYARRYVTGAGLDAGESQLSNSPRGVASPRMVVDGADVFTAIWIEDSDAFDGSKPGGGPNHPTPYARKFITGSWETNATRIGWDPASYLGNFDGAGRMDVAVNSAGDILVAWEQQHTQVDTSVLSTIDVARYSASGGSWSNTPTTLSSNTWSLDIPSVALDSAGNGAVGWLWTNPADTSLYSIRLRRYTVASDTWESEETMDATSAASSMWGPQVGMDGIGNIFVAWEEAGRTTQRRFDNTLGTPVWSAISDMGTGYDVMLGVGSGGHAQLTGESSEIDFSIPGVVYFMNVWTYTP